ncbi:hypothetical protein ANTRET_LOCUS1323 [Anthophora retusa]
MDSRRTVFGTSGKYTLPRPGAYSLWFRSEQSSTIGATVHVEICKLVFSRRNSRRFLFHSPSRVARVARSSTETAFSVAEYAQKWEQLLVLQRNILNAAIDQVSQFRGQLLQEEQISQKMTRTRNSRYN